LDEANGTEEPRKYTSGKRDEKPKEGGARPRVLADETTTARLEAVNVAAKL
jgi:coatomer subunit beta